MISGVGRSEPKPPTENHVSLASLNQIHTFTHHTSTQSYLTCLPPKVSYGCEKGRAASSRTSKSSSTLLFGLHWKVLFHILGVSATTPEDILLYELNLHIDRELNPSILGS